MWSKIVQNGMNIYRNLGGTVQVVAAINVLVALLAFCKDVGLAMYLGTSLHADALSLAWFIPDTVGSSLLGSAIGVACVPIFSELLVLGEKERLNDCLRRIFVHFIGISLLLLGLFYWFHREMVAWVGDGTGSPLADLTHDLLLVILPVLSFVPLVAIGSAALQALGYFRAPAAAPLWMNGAIFAGVTIGTLAQLPLKIGTSAIAVSMTAGAMAMALFIWISLLRGASRKHGLLAGATMRRSLRHKDGATRDLREIYRIFAPYLLILLSTQSVYFTERYLASALDTGVVAGLNYAFRLAQFPIWVYVAAVSAVILPSLSKAMALRKDDELRETLVKAFNNILLVTLPTTAFFFILRQPLVSVLFQRGAFDAESLRVTADLLEGYALTIVGQAIVAICLRYFLASREIRLPLYAFALSSFVNIAADFFFVGWWGAKGIGYGAMAGTMLNTVLLLAMLNQKLGLLRFYGFRTPLKIAAANVPPLGILIVNLMIWTGTPALQSGWPRFAFMFCAFVLFVLVYGFCIQKIVWSKRPGGSAV